MKRKRFLSAVVLLVISTLLLSTASFAWFSMNTSVGASGFKIEAYSDSLILEISKESNGTYRSEVDFKTDDETALRLVTLVHLTEGALTISATEITENIRYSSSDPQISGKTYYKKTSTDPERNDTYEGENYISLSGMLSDASDVSEYYNATEGNIGFTVINSSAVVFDADSAERYYKKVGNTYYKLVLDNEDGNLEINEISEGETLRGYYTITFDEKCGNGAVYDGTSLYYEVKSNGDVAPVGSLVLGTPLKGLYTVAETETGVSTSDDGVKYYLKNDRGDYVCIGSPESETNLLDYMFWARTYSSSAGDVGANKTLNVLKQAALDNYYLQNTVYLRMNEDAENGENLRIGSVEVRGDDKLTNAIRVLVVTKNSTGEVSRAIYNNRTGDVTYIDNAENVLYKTVPGHRADVITADIYIYFEGTDDAAKTEGVILSGQTVSVNFEIDKPDYAP